MNSNALVAQLDRVTDYESVGQGFESLRARQSRMCKSIRLYFFIFTKHMIFSCPKTAERV